MIEIPAGWGVVVDLDDTLYAEWDFHDSGFAAVAARAGVADLAASVECMKRTARSGEDAFGVVARETGHDPAELLDWHRTHHPAITPFPGAMEFLSGIVASGDSFAVVTDGRSVTQRNKLRALGVLELTSKVFISEEVGAGKPDPLIFERAKAALGARLGYVYVADNPAKDFVTPNRMGWMTVMIRDQGMNVHSQATESEGGKRADAMVDGWFAVRRCSNLWSN